MKLINLLQIEIHFFIIKYLDSNNFNFELNFEIELNT